MTATFGDLASQADKHFTAALRRLEEATGDVTSGTAAAVHQVGRIAAVLARYAIVPADVGPRSPPSTLAIAIAGADLQHAAAQLLPQGP